MKTHLLIITLTALCHAQENPKYPYRPYSEFYETGKAGRRLEEYNKSKDSDISKKYFLEFSQNDFDKLSIYQVVSSEDYGHKLAIKTMKLHEVFDKKNPTFGQFVDFFKRSFPENPRRLPDESKSGQILIFSGPTKQCIIYIPGFSGPEFSILEGVEGQIIVGKTYTTSNGAMSASPPFDYFFKMWDSKLIK